MTLGVEFRLAPLLKGLTVGKIVAQFIETCEVAVSRCEMNASPVIHKSNRLISTSTFSADACQQLESSDEEFDGYRFVKTFDLPKTLNKCVQDADVKDIKIRHKLKFRIQLHNPDRHVSEVRTISCTRVYPGDFVPLIGPPLPSINVLSCSAPHQSPRVPIYFATSRTREEQ
jgi:hypothetical protein